MVSTTSGSGDSAAIETYSTLQKLLHWGVVLGIALQFLVLDSIGRWMRPVMTEGVHTYNVTTLGHILVGSLVLVAAITRLILRHTRGTPPLPAGTTALVARASGAVHTVLYILLFALPLSGLIAWFGAVGTAASVHEVLTTALLVVMAGHVLGALVHQFVFRDNLIRRMI